MSEPKVEESSISGKLNLSWVPIVYDIINGKTVGNWLQQKEMNGREKLREDIIISLNSAWPWNHCVLFIPMQLIHYLDICGEISMYQEENPNHRSILSARKGRLSGTNPWASPMPETFSGFLSFTGYRWTGCAKVLTCTDPGAAARM